MAQIVRKGTPRGQTDANQAYRTDRGVTSGGYDTSGTLGADLSRHSGANPRGQTDANHPDPGQRPSPASMVPSHMAQIQGHPQVHPGLQRVREGNPALRTNGLPPMNTLPPNMPQQGLPPQPDMCPGRLPPKPRAATIPEDDYPVQN
jgi:hypothetical protein